MLRPISALLLLGWLLSTTSPASVGRARIAKYAPTEFNTYIDSPTPEEAQWMRDHYARMLVFSPYFDSRLAWHPNGWVYKDLYAIYVGSSMATAHPEWILRDVGGRALYIPFDCSRGTCPQYAGDIGNSAFRADWIATASGLLAEGYIGLMVDDVNMLIDRVSDGNENPVLPHDPRTGTTMTETDWRRYMAEFVEEIRAAFPTKEIVHNALWFAPTSDHYVQRQLQAANVVCIERGFNDGGIVYGGHTYGFETLLGVIDWLHARGRGVWLDAEATSNTAREYGLAAYLLTTTGIDYIGNTPGAEWDHWWPGYDLDLGAPLGPRTYRRVFQREFQGGRVLVNQPGSRAVTVELGGRFLRVNGESVKRVTLGAGHGAVLRRAGATTTPTTSMPTSTTAPPTCPIGSGHPDADGDGLADACDPCTRTVPTGAGRAKLSFAKLLQPAGGHRLKFKGYFTDVPLEPTIDPLANGIRVLIRDRTEAARIDVTIAGGAYDRRTRAGWQLNEARTVWRYKSSGSVTPLANGIAKVRIRKTASPAGTIQFSVTGRHGYYPIDEDDLPLTGTLVIDPPVARTGQCGEATFPAAASGGYGCSVSRGGDTIRCRSP
jgi:hypothetical protein